MPSGTPDVAASHGEASFFLSSEFTLNPQADVGLFQGKAWNDVPWSMWHSPHVSYFTGMR